MPDIEAIRARWDADPSNTYSSDVGTLLAELDRIKAGDVRTEYGLDDGASLPWVYRTRGDAENDHTPADKLLVREVYTTAWRAAPVAPDAEPTEWEWSNGDVVVTDDAVWTRVKGSINYPWRSVTGSDQRDQDITDLVTKHGGRVLVCKARGIGGAS